MAAVSERRQTGRRIGVHANHGAYQQAARLHYLAQPHLNPHLGFLLASFGDRAQSVAIPLKERFSQVILAGQGNVWAASLTGYSPEDRHAAAQAIVNHFGEDTYLTLPSELAQEVAITWATVKNRPTNDISEEAHYWLRGAATARNHPRYIVRASALGKGRAAEEMALCWQAVYPPTDLPESVAARQTQAITQGFAGILEHSDALLWRSGHGPASSFRLYTELRHETTFGERHILVGAGVGEHREMAALFDHLTLQNARIIVFADLQDSDRQRYLCDKGFCAGAPERLKTLYLE